MERLPAVAGMFYPADKEELKRMLDNFFSIDVAPRSGIGIIAPHAGYIYSGQTAAYAYASYTELGHAETVVVVGPSHYASFNGIAISKADWLTPLGLMRNEGDYPAFFDVQFNENYFTKEHSIEVQLPFIQYLNPDARLVPILTGFMMEQDILMLAEFLKYWLDMRRAAIVISSDFNHYLPVVEAMMLDGEAFSYIEKYDYRSLAFNPKFSICGVNGIAAMLKVAKDLEAKPVLLKHTSSGDVNGDYSSVVTYASWIFER